MSLLALCRTRFIPFNGAYQLRPIGTSSIYRAVPKGKLLSTAARVEFDFIFPQHRHLKPPRRTQQYATLPNIPFHRLLEPGSALKEPNAFVDDRLPPLEKFIFDHVCAVSASIPLASIYREYKSKTGHVLDVHLPYESRPSSFRQAAPLISQNLEREDDGVFLIAHIAVAENGQRTVSLSSGFALDTTGEEGKKGVQCIVTCCHTLEEITRTMQPESLVSPSGIYVVPSSGIPIPVTGVHSSLPRHDILLLSLPSNPELRTLPLSPYPAPNGSILSTRLFSSPGRPELQSMRGGGEWTGWLGGHALRKWVTGGKVLGYRDLAGRESKTGTYDALSHILFNVLPTPGSSGAPLVDEYGAVVGMVLGTRIDNRVEGNRGWGVPAELIFEMFSLPGLELNSG